MGKKIIKKNSILSPLTSFSLQQTTTPLNTISPPTNIEPIKPPKLTLPQFDGTNPLEWVFQAEQFFTHYSIAPPNRLSYISCYMVGHALGWYQWMHHNNLLSTWEEFTRGLELRFGPSTFENHQQALFKLHQTTSVADY